MDDPPIIGLAEMAAFLDVDKRTPLAWWHRQILPPPEYACINRAPAWDLKTVVIWAGSTGRLPERHHHYLPGFTPPRKRGGREQKRIARQERVMKETEARRQERKRRREWPDRIDNPYPGERPS